MTNIPRISYRSTDLEGFFTRLAKEENLPSFEDLLSEAQVLAGRHATTRAFSQAHDPATGARTADSVPYGSPKNYGTPTDDVHPVVSPQDVHEDDAMEDCLSDLTVEEKEERTDNLRPDVTLANATLFIRNAIWWREECQAVAEGDTGRVWEILKVSIIRYMNCSQENSPPLDRYGFSRLREVVTLTIVSTSLSCTAILSGNSLTQH